MKTKENAAINLKYEKLSYKCSSLATCNFLKASDDAKGKKLLVSTPKNQFLSMILRGGATKRKIDFK